MSIYHKGDCEKSRSIPFLGRPVQSNEDKVSLSGEKRRPLMWFKPTTEKLRVRRATHCTTPVKLIDPHLMVGIQLIFNLNACFHVKTAEWLISNLTTYLLMLLLNVPLNRHYINVNTTQLYRYTYPWLNSSSMLFEVVSMVLSKRYISSLVKVSPFKWRHKYQR